MVRFLAGALVGACMGGYAALAGVVYASDITVRDRLVALSAEWCYDNDDKEWRQNVVCLVAYVIEGEY